MPGILRNNRYGIPIAALSAYSGSGKTTFMEKLIPELKARGIRLAIIKHDVHGITLDPDGKDSRRFTEAGADTVIVHAPDKALRIDNGPRSVRELLDSINDADLILLEGYKHEPFPRMLLYRSGAGQPPAFDPAKKPPLCIISDQTEWPGVEAPVFSLEDAGKAAELLTTLCPDRGHLPKNGDEPV